MNFRKTPILKRYGSSTNVVFNAASVDKYGLREFSFCSFSYDLVRQNIRMRFSKTLLDESYIPIKYYKKAMKVYGFSPFRNRCNLPNDFEAPISEDDVSGVYIAEVRDIGGQVEEKIREKKEKAVAKPKPAPIVAPVPKEVHPSMTEAMDRAIAAGVKVAVATLIDELKGLLVGLEEREK